MEALIRRKKEYEELKVQYDGLVDVYRTEPDKTNLMRLGPCATIAFLNNTDIRNYLLVDSSLSLDEIPEDTLSELGPLELWKVEEDPHRAFFFFNILFDKHRFSREL
ncbi:MAG: hypothetical protein ACOY4W_00820 [Thermodesulfobacteriota bacterium]